MRIAIAGDISITDASRPIFEKADERTAFNSVIGVFKECDRVIVNLECALTDSENAIKKFGPNLKGPKQTAETFVKAGITDCALSNNHIFDFGIEGMNDTLEQLDKTGLKWTGFGNNYQDSRKALKIQGDVDIAVINVCEHEYSYATDERMGARPFDEFETMDDIRRAKADNDYVVVIYHGGKEYCRYPSPRLMKACREMVKCGADVVLCQHSHCIGCYENYEGAHILYGQGNFHFVNYRNLDGWNTGLIVTLDFSKEKVDINFIPTVSGDVGIDLARGEEKEKVLDDFKKRNTELENGEWKKHWREFCEKNYAMYKNAISGYKPEDDLDKIQLFAHYLDCEAHTDVWRELFYTWNKTNELDI